MDFRRIPILVYHRVVPNHRAAHYTRQDLPEHLFAQQMRFLHEAGYRTLSLVDFVKGDTVTQKKQKLCVITFDDGYRDFVTRALPSLKHYGFTATIFIVTEYTEHAEQEQHLDPSDSILSWDEIRALSDEGITFGSHTHSHKDLRSLNPEQIRHELTESKHRLEDQLDRDITLLAYPYGASNAQVRQFAQSAGYTTAFGVNTGPPGPFNVWRRLYGARALWKFEFWLSRWYYDLQVLRRRMRQLRSVVTGATHRHG